MHKRLIAMIEHVDAFIALQGGLDTLEEIFTIASWAQLNINQKPIRLIDVNHYYSLFTMFLNDIVRHGFLYSSSRRIFVHVNTAFELIDRLQEYQPKTTLFAYQLDWSNANSGKKCKI